MITRTKITATPVYPGSFYSEEGRSVEISDSNVEAAVAAVGEDDKMFAIEVATRKQKRWTDGDGGEMWTDLGRPKSFRIYFGESLTIEDVEQLPGNNEILLSNMRINGWNPIVRTRRGNFQPLAKDDVIYS